MKTRNYIIVFLIIVILAMVVFGGRMYAKIEARLAASKVREEYIIKEREEMRKEKDDAIAEHRRLDSMLQNTHTRLIIKHEKVTDAVIRLSDEDLRSEFINIK